MTRVMLAQFFDSFLDLADAVLGAHRLRREIGVGAGTVPRSVDGFRVERRDDTVLLGHAVKNETGDPEVVTGTDSLARSDLRN